MNSYIDEYTTEELQQIVSLSHSWRGLARNLGYTTFSGAIKKTLENRLKDFDTSHFDGMADEKIKRTPENTFVENSTAAQKTLRKMYYEGAYTEYKCSICGQEPIWQGKPLTLILDHINGINNDDKLENLRWVCPNCNAQLETSNGKNIKKKPFQKKFYCIKCGKEITGTGKTGLCSDCFYKQKVQNHLETLPVSREELKDLIRKESFLEIGQMFNVSDNAIRKWCDKYNLPRKKTDIKKISDKDWLSI